MNEIWKDIIGYCGFYQISNFGRVFSLPRPGTTGGIIKPGRNNAYLQIILYKNGKSKTKLIHTLVLESFVGLRPEGMECRHLDGNGNNNQSSNLRWSNHSINMKDKFIHKTDNNGVKHPMSILTDSCVVKIRTLYATGEWTQLALAKKYNIERTAISRAVNKKTWRYVK